MRKKKILFIIDRMKGGGAQKAAHSILNGLSEEKYHKFIYIFDNEGCQYDFEATVIDGHCGTTSNPFTKLFHLFKRYRQLSDIRKEMDVCVSFLGTPNLLNLLTRKVGGKTILSERNFLSGSSNKDVKFYKWVVRLLYNKADYIVGVSKEVSEDLVENYGIDPDMVTSITNFIEVDSVKEKSKAFKVDASLEPYLLCAGRLHKHKGFAHAINGFALYKEKYNGDNNNLKLLIIGEGDERERLEELIKKRGLEESVYLLGYQNNPYPYYKNAEAFLLTSYVEGFPNVVIEAMACNTSVIAANCRSGPYEIIEPDVERVTELTLGTYGVLVPAFKYDDSKKVVEVKEKVLSEGIEILIEKAGIKEHYNSKAYERALDYNKEKIIKQWERIIDRDLEVANEKREGYSQL